MGAETYSQDAARARISRRQLFGGALTLGAGVLALNGGFRPRSAAAARAPNVPHHLIWVWQFSTDAAPNVIGVKLRDHGLGLVLKTHDGVQWMSQYDKSPYAVSGPAQVEVLANYFEDGGVPFHAWTVVQGVDPVREARMAADVLKAGARSLYLDLEPHSGFWRGTVADAVAYGSELRRLQPDARIVMSIDPRPWMLGRLPLKEFAAFSNEIAPQQYWRTFDTQANYDKFIEGGFPVGAGSMTPEFLLGVARQVLTPFGLPINHVGQGATPEPDEWRRFVEGSYSTGSDSVTVWRYGVTNEGIFSLLRDTPPVRPIPVAGDVYVVQPGDTLFAIAVAHGTTIDNIVALNKLPDVNYIYVGQELVMPGGAAVAVTASSAPAASDGAPKTYTVQSGDTLSGIAGRFGTSVDALVAANSLSDPGMLSIGQELRIL
jgi:LysM repeat protein